MEALRVTFCYEFYGIPYVVDCEDDPVSDADLVWLRDHVFGPGDPIVDLSPESDGPPELFRCLYLDGNFLTEISAVLAPEARPDPALQARHAHARRALACPPPGPGGCAREECRAEARRARASSSPSAQGRA